MNLERIDDLKDAENNVVRHRSLMQREKQRKNLLHKHKRGSRKLQVATERRRTHWPMLRDAPFTVSYLLLNSYFGFTSVSSMCRSLPTTRGQIMNSETESFEGVESSEIRQMSFVSWWRGAKQLKLIGDRP